VAKEMLINYVRGEECRIAVVEDGQLEELYTERASASSHVGNVYKGRVTNVEPSIQAAFVDFGLEKNGFLHISDLSPQYFPSKRGEEKSKQEAVGRKTPRRERPPIQKCLRRGQEVIVQVIKEGIGSKGPTLTTYISVPGRFLVMMPGMNRLGVSRKIEDEETRRRLKEVVSELGVPKNTGFIVRTAGIDRNKRDLQRDLNYLKRLWKVVQHRINTSKAPAELYQESDLVTRTIRDVFTSDIKKILVDDPDVARKAKDFLSIVMPRYQDRVAYYDEPVPLFHKYGIEAEIAKINSRRVELPNGGHLVFDQTEALVAIDVNSGKFREQASAEETALQMNLEAVKEIVRQLRLRDLGGVVIIDFIDMRSDSNRRKVERALREAMKKDRAKTKILRISALGIVELTRQRMRPSLAHSIFTDCPHCHGLGKIKTPESLSLDVVRMIQLALNHEETERVQVTVSPEVLEYLQNRHRRTLVELEEQTGKRIELFVGRHLGPDQMRFTCLDGRDRNLQLPELTH